MLEAAWLAPDRTLDSEMPLTGAADSGEEEQDFPLQCRFGLPVQVRAFRQRPDDGRFLAATRRGRSPRIFVLIILRCKLRTAQDATFGLRVGYQGFDLLSTHVPYGCQKRPLIGIRDKIVIEEKRCSLRCRACFCRGSAIKWPNLPWQGVLIAGNSLS